MSHRTKLGVVLAVLLSLLAIIGISASSASAAPPKKAPTVSHVGQVPKGCTQKLYAGQRLAPVSNNASSIIEAYCKEGVSAKPSAITSKVQRCTVPQVGNLPCARWTTISHTRRFVDRGHDYALDSEISYKLVPPVNYMYRASGTITWTVLRSGHAPEKIQTPYSRGTALRGTDYDVVAR